MRIYTRFVSYTSTEGRHLSLEHRLFLSSVLAGLVISIIGSVMTIVLSLSLVSIFISIVLSFFLSFIYYFARFKGIIEPFILPIILASYIGIFSIWIFAGGMKGPNILPAAVILIFTLLIVPVRYRRHVFFMFLAGIIIVYLLQYFNAAIIIDYPSENARWTDSFITTIYCSICIYLIINYIHKHYTIERLRAEKNETYNVITNQLTDWVCLTDLNGNFISVNSALSRMTGYSENELLKMSVFNLESVSQLQWHLNENGTNKDGIPYLKRILCKDGREFIAEIATSIIAISGQNFLLSTGKDITERIQAEYKIREKDIQFRKLSANVSDLIFQFTRKPDGTYCVPIASEGIRNIFGCSPEDVIDDFTPIARVIYPEDAERVISDIENSAAHLSPFTCEFRVQIPGRSIQWIYSRSTPEKLPDGSITWYGFNADITDRHQAELLLKEKSLEIENRNKELNQANEELAKAKEISENNEFRLKMAMEVSRSGAWEWNIPQNTFYWSDEFLRLFGLPGNTIAGFEAWTKVLHPDDLEMASKKIMEAIENRTELLSDYRIILPGGGVRWIRATGHTSYLNELPEKMIGLCMDISIQKMTEQELILAKEHAEESDKLKSSFLANMSHEIRTPMNGILGFTDLLKEPNLSSDEQTKYINIIGKSGVRMLNIISEIIDISKIESGQMEVSIQEININKKLNDIYVLLKPDADWKKINLSFKSSLSDGNAIAYTDREKLDSILTNLVKNAIKYTDKGSIVFGCELKNETIEFFVKDTGIGIPKDRHEAIFERFIQADIHDIHARQGAGLGLSISKAFVEMLGGRIWVESEKGTGSTFYFTLPYQTKPSINLLDKSSGLKPDILLPKIQTTG